MQPFSPTSCSFSTIISYIDDQFERYLHDESGLNRRHIVDNRVHCCFYFISPLGHGWDLRHIYVLFCFFLKSISSDMNFEPFSDSLLCVSCLSSLKPLDVQFMKAIHNKVNVVPVIAKADTLTLRERERLKRRVSQGIFWFTENDCVCYVLQQYVSSEASWKRNAQYTIIERCSFPCCA